MTMRNLTMNLLNCSVLLAGTLFASPAAAQELVVFAFDMSTSAPVAVDANIARTSGSYAASMVTAMQPGDKIMLRSLGTAGLAAQQIKIDVMIGRKANSRADRIAPAIGDLIASLPEHVARGDIETQPQTNIVGFLEALAPSLDCPATPTRIVIFSDGIEWSTQVRGDDLLAGTADLPSPSGPILEDCIVEMRGLGQVTLEGGTDARWFPLLRTQWQSFFEAAGVAQFSAYAAFD